MLQETTAPPRSVRREDMTNSKPPVAYANQNDAQVILNRAAEHINQRATDYDCPGKGERSMAKTVAMFNELAGTRITETQGWQFMQILKMVRSSQGNFKADNFEDGAAYAALAGECAAKEISQE